MSKVYKIRKEGTTGQGLLKVTKEKQDVKNIVSSFVDNDSTGYSITILVEKEDE